jgi:hypothetical protein
MYKGTAAAYWSSLYSVRNVSSDDIDGTYEYKYFLLYKNKGLAEDGIETIELSKMYLDSKFLAYTIRVGFIGSKWRFMDDFKIKIGDDDVITLSPHIAPQRGVSGREVEEINQYLLTEDIIDRLKNTDKLIVQAYVKPVSIPEEGIIVMKQFMDE